MALFRYRALDREGAPFEGFMDEPSPRRVVQYLLERKCRPQSVERYGKRRWHFPGFARVCRGELGRLFEALHFAAANGRPATEALETLTRDAPRGAFASLCNDLRRKIEAGSSLSDAMSAHLECFTPVCVRVAARGEKTGNPAGALGQLAPYTALPATGEGKWRSGASINVGSVVLLFAVVYFLAVFLIGPMEGVYNEFGSRLPSPTSLCIAVSRALTKHGLGLASVVVVGLGILVPAVRVLRKTRTGIAIVDGLRSRIPGWGRIYRLLSLARFSHALGLLITGAGTLEESLDLAGRAAGNGVLRRAAATAAERIASGMSFSDAFGDTKDLPNSFICAIGRKKAGRTLIALAESYEGHARRQRWTRLRVVPALCLLMIFGVAGFAVVSVYLPIFKLFDTLSGM